MADKKKAAEGGAPSGKKKADKAVAAEVVSVPEVVSAPAPGRSRRRYRNWPRRTNPACRGARRKLCKRLIGPSRLVGSDFHRCCDGNAAFAARTEFPFAARYHQDIGTDWKDNLRVVLVSTRNPLNIGAAARAMANFGFSRLRLVAPYDVAYREARSAVGAAALLRNAEEYSSVGDAVADCRLVVGSTSVGHRELNHPLRRLEYGSRLIRKGLDQAPVALLFGSEKFGLSNEDLSHCHWLTRIPTLDPQPSMNLGQAVALCLYELSRDSRAAAAKPAKSKIATAEENEQITALLMDALERSGYVNPVPRHPRAKKHAAWCAA